MRRILCSIGAYVYLYAYSCSFYHNVKYVPCSCGVQIGFSTDFANLSRNVFKDHSRGIPLKRHSGGSWLCFPLLANDTFHGFFLLKSDTHPPKTYY